jgi:hypothetical protein
MKHLSTWRSVLSWEVPKPVWRRGNHYLYLSATKDALPVVTVNFDSFLTKKWEVNIHYPEKGKYIQKEENTVPGAMSSGNLLLMVPVKSFKGKGAYSLASQFADALAIEKGYIRMRGFEELEDAKRFSSQELSDKQIESLNNVLDIQGSDGNWNYEGDPNYMTGMYNGMELMDSIVDNRDPKFRDVPKKASLKLSWEVQEETPGNPNKYAIESVREEVGSAGIFFKTFEDLNSYLEERNIDCYPTILSAFKMYSQTEDFDGYIMRYTPMFHSEKVYLEICLVRKPKDGSNIRTTDSHLRIY